MRSHSAQSLELNRAGRALSNQQNKSLEAKATCDSKIVLLPLPQPWTFHHRPLPPHRRPPLAAPSPTSAPKYSPTATSSAHAGTRETPPPPRVRAAQARRRATYAARARSVGGGSGREACRVAIGGNSRGAYGTTLRCGLGSERQRAEPRDRVSGHLRPGAHSDSVEGAHEAVLAHTEVAMHDLVGEAKRRSGRPQMSCCAK